MGAAASIESQKPTDASDIAESNSVIVARNEVARLRKDLGHFARNAGFAEVVYDVSDLVLEENEKEDFDRCINEIVHIRKALRLSTQNARRRTRQYEPHQKLFDEGKSDSKDSEDSDESN